MKRIVAVMLFAVLIVTADATPADGLTRPGPAPGLRLRLRLRG